MKCLHVCVLSRFSHVRLFATPWMAAHQAPLSMGILQARILESAALLQGIFPTQGSNLCLPWLMHCRQMVYHRATGETLRAAVGAK